jgi:SAM-dependent methyltransferase
VGSPPPIPCNVPQPSLRFLRIVEDAILPGVGKPAVMLRYVVHSRPPHETMTNDICFSDMSGSGVHEKVLELAGPYVHNGRILVAGSGEGSLEYKLLRCGVAPQNIFSLDQDPGLFKLDNVNIQFCDLNGRIPFDDGYFDICFATEVIEHLHNPHNLIDEAYRVLKPSALLFLSTPNVHSYMQKIRYLLTDRFAFFDEGFLDIGHFHPLFEWQLRRMIHDKFEIAGYTSQSFHLRLIPKLPLVRVPFKHRFFAVNNIYLLTKTAAGPDRP